MSRGDVGMDGESWEHRGWGSFQPPKHSREQLGQGRGGKAWAIIDNASPSSLGWVFAVGDSGFGLAQGDADFLYFSDFYFCSFPSLASKWH